MSKKSDGKNGKLPKTVYVKWEQDGGEGYLIVLKDLIGEEEGAIIGSYTLATVDRLNVTRTLEAL